MAKNNKDDKRQKVKTPQALMKETGFQETPQVEKDTMEELVQRYQKLDPVRTLQIGDKIIKFCTWDTPSFSLRITCSLASPPLLGVSLKVHSLAGRGRGGHAA